MENHVSGTLRLRALIDSLPKLSRKALILLRKIGNTEEASYPLNRRNAVAATELVGLGLAAYIYESTGGANVCLTPLGVLLERYR